MRLLRFFILFVRSNWDPFELEFLVVLNWNFYENIYFLFSSTKKSHSTFLFCDLKYCVGGKIRNFWFLLTRLSKDFLLFLRLKKEQSREEWKMSRRPTFVIDLHENFYDKNETFGGIFKLPKLQDSGFSLLLWWSLRVYFPCLRLRNVLMNYSLRTKLLRNKINANNFSNFSVAVVFLRIVWVNRNSPTAVVISLSPYLPRRYELSNIFSRKRCEPSLIKQKLNFLNS